MLSKTTQTNGAVIIVSLICTPCPKAIIKKILKENGFFIMLCFADGDNVADEINDLEFYNSRRVGVAFSKERIIRFFEGNFEILEIYKGKNQITEDYMEIPFLYNCIMKKR